MNALASGMPRLSWVPAALLLLAFSSPACAQTEDTAAPASATPANPPAAAPATARALPDFTGLVDQYGAAVVNVVSTRQAAVPASSPLSPDDPLYEFFRRFGIPIPGIPNGQAPPPQVQRGEGSGFIVNSEGYILSNAHVVDQASHVTVKLQDRREFTAKVIGVDRRTDVAVLKIDAHDLPTVKFGDSSKLKPGEWVVAIGSPFGFENSVTAGVVSATARAVGAQGSIVPFIQTDVAVNPGNSGGPLFNMRGEVVGINSMIYSGTGGYQGISFAIPIDVALDVERQLIQYGHVTRGRIGVTIQNVNAELARSFGLDRPRGALVSSVEQGGPAAEAGLQPGDIIVGVQGQKIETSPELPGVIAHLRPGTTASLDIVRNGKPQRVEVRIARLKEPGAERTAAQQGGGAKTPKLGLSVRPLTPEEQSEVQIKGGLVIEQVSGPAVTAGLQPGDIILRVGNAPVSSIEELQRAAEKSPGTLALLIQRQDARIYVPLRLE